MTARSSLGDRLSVALGAELPDACPGDLAIAAETVVVEWLHEQAADDHTCHSSTDPRCPCEVLNWLADQIVAGLA